MNFTVYKPNGQIINAGSCIESDYEHQVVPVGCLIAPLSSDPMRHYVGADGQVQDLPAAPDSASFFDYESKVWRPDPARATVIVLSKRSALLRRTDWTSLPDAQLSGEQRAKWLAYRQALRDITDQDGYPLEVTWPSQP